MAGFLSAAMAAIGSSGIGNAVVRILIAYGVSRLINRNQPDPNASAPIDTGVRLQASPDTTNPIPLLFGSAYFGGRITDAQLVDQNKVMWFCLTLSEVPNITTRLSDSATIKTNIDSVYLDNQLVTFKSDGITVDYVTNQDEGTVNTSPRDLVQIYLYEKGSFAPTLPSNFLSGGSPIAPAVLPADARTLFPDWTNDHRMANLTFALVKVTYNRDKGITALPNLQFQVSNNLFKPGDALYSYMTNTVSGAGIDAGDIDTATLVALNSYSADTVNYFDESDNTVKTLANRYQINGLVNTKDNVLANLQRLADNSGAFLNYDITTGTWGVVINRDSAPVLSFNDTNIISGIDLTGTSLDSLYNSVRVEFPHRQVRDQRDIITLDLPTDYRNANEPDNELQITLDLINEPLQARELGYLALYQNRMDQVVTFATDYSKINTEAGDVISITSSVYGWTNKPYRVIRVKEIETEDGGIAVEITAQEYDETMYTAGGQLRRPRVPTKPIAIPDINIIGTPAAPTITQFNTIAVPYIRLSGVIPSGIVDRFEFWASSTAGYADSTFTLLGTVSNSNGSPYVQGTSVIFTAEALLAATYKFKVRAGNESGFGSYSTLTAENVWLPVQVTDQISNTTTVSPGTDLLSLLPILGAGALAYFAYKALYPQLLSALSTTELGKLLGIPTDAEVILQKAKLDAQTNPFQEFVVGANNILSTVTPTVTLVAGTGMTISADSISGEITFESSAGASFKTATVGTDVVSASAGTDIKLTHGAGINIEAFPGTNTIKFSYDGAIQEDTNDFNTDRTVDFGVVNLSKINVTNTWIMDDCEITQNMPPKMKREAGTYALPMKYITGGGTYTDPCYNYTFSTLKIPELGATPNNGHPRLLGSFVPPYSQANPFIAAATLPIYYRIIAPNEVIAYCYFDDEANPLPITDQCNIAPGSRTPNSTLEFPSGTRFVTYGMLSSWAFSAGGYGIPISTTQYETIAREFYPGVNKEYIRQARVCQNANGSEPSLVIS